MRFAVAVDVMPKGGISDPQGQAVQRALPTLGFDGIHHVRVGKRIELLVEALDEAGAVTQVEAACERILANPVMEDYAVASVTLVSHPAVTGGQGA